MKNKAFSLAVIACFLFILVTVFDSCKDKDKTDVTPEGTMTDSRDGNTYNTIIIGEQTWFAENLAYLPSVSPSADSSFTDPYYYVYNYQGSDVATAKATDNYITYGVLYNWSAAMAGTASSNTNSSNVQGVCPSGWHLPSDDEWKQLEMYIGMSQSQADGEYWRGGNFVGKKLKSTSGWSGSWPGTDLYGFNALPGGYRYYEGAFSALSDLGNFWSSSESNTNGAWHRMLSYIKDGVSRIDYPTDHGFSVRCVKD